MNTLDSAVNRRGRWKQVKLTHQARLRGSRAHLVERDGQKLPKCRGPHVGPHNACTHATADPPGTRRCAGDPACEVFIPARWAGALCSFHRDEAAIRQQTAHDRMVVMMEGRGAQ